MRLAYLILTICICSVVVTCLPEPTSPYVNQMILVEPDVYMLYWNYTNDDIVFEIHVKNNGWAAFGLSPNGGMDKSDVIVTWMKENGENVFSDRHISGRQVLLDEEQNWFPLNATFVDGYLISKFTRKIRLCDASGEDMDITVGTPHVIYAWSTVFNNDDITYHGHENRGSRVVPLISSLNAETDLDIPKTVVTNYRVNTTIPDIDTEYYCQMFELPEEWMEKKRHILRFEALFTKGNEKNLHHFVINECQSSFETQFLKNNTIPAPGSCYPRQTSEENTWRKASVHCNKISFVWAVGGSVIQDFPNNFAYPLGGNVSESKYFFLQIHYDNPELKKDAKDFSGIRLFSTTDYRDTEFGIYSVGAISNWTGIVIPPQAEKFRYESTCHKDCFNTLFDTTDEVKVFASLPHTHLQGISVTTSIVRNNTEVDYVTNNQNFDFNYQFLNFNSNPVTLKKNDTLRTTCIYNTKNKDSFVIGGHSTREEMCLNFIWYYPRNAGSTRCTSMIDHKIWGNFLKELNSSSEITFNGSEFPINNKELLDISPINTGQSLVAQFQDFYDNANRTQICGGSSGLFSFVNEPMDIEPIVDDVCVKSSGDNIYL